MNEIQGSIIDAIKTLVNNAVDNIQADTTIIATISKEVSMDNKMYYAEYNGGTIPVYANEFIYHVGDVVYVLVPQGNMSNRKVIVSLVDGSEGTNKNKDVLSLGDYEKKDNCISDKTYPAPDENSPAKRVFPVELSSQIANQTKVLYISSDYAAEHKEFGLTSEDINGTYNNPMLDVANKEFVNAMNSSQAMLLTANIQTDFSSDLPGDFGVLIAYKYMEENSNEILTKTVLLNTAVMRGNTKKLSNKYIQYVIEEFEGTFIDLSLIAVYCKNYVVEDSESPISDINVSNISLYPLEENALEYNGYRLAISYPFGTTFESMNANEKLNLTASVYKDGNDITSQCSFIWAKANPSITAGSEGYNINFGEGCAYLGKDYDKYTISISAADNPAKDNIYYCIAKCGDELAGKSNGIHIKNSAAECVGQFIIGTDSTVYNHDDKYEYSKGKNEITSFKCIILNEKTNEIVDTEDNADYEFYWTITDCKGKSYPLNKTLAALEKEKEEQLESLKKTGYTTDGKMKQQEYLVQWTLENQIASFVSSDDNLINSELKIDVASATQGSGKLTCSVKYKNAIFVNCELSLVSAVDVFSSPRVEIEGGNQSFQYSIAGVSPAHESAKNPQEIQPLIAKVYSKKNELITEESITKYNWIFPTEESMIVAQESSVRNTLNFGIADKYNHYATDNQIKVEVSLNDGGLVIVGVTNFNFSKVGADGSNGSENTVTISETNLTSLTDEDNEIVRLVLYKEGDEYKWNTNAREGLVKIDQVENIFSGNVFANGNEFTSLKAEDTEWVYPTSCYNADKKEYDTHYKYDKDGIFQVVGGKNQKNNEILTFHVKNISNLSDGLDHYANYPIPSITYNGSFGYTNKKITILNSRAAKFVEYSASGKSPVHNNYAGVSLKFDWDYDKIVWTSQGVNISLVPGGLPQSSITAPSTLYSVEGKASYNTLKSQLSVYKDNKRFIKSSEELESLIKSSVSLEKAESSVKKYIEENYPQASLQDETEKVYNLLNKYIVVELENIYAYLHSINPKKVYLIPYDLYDPAKSKISYIEGKIYIGNTLVATVITPVHVFMNYYENANVIGWDGTTAEVGDTYLAGTSSIFGKKTDGKLTGVMLGKVENSNLERTTTQIGLLAYSEGEQTAFLDAETGRFTLGRNDEIVLEPDENTPSKIGGWHIGEQSLYRVLDTSGSKTTNVQIKEVEGQKTVIDDGYSGILLNCNSEQSHIEVQKAVKNRYTLSNPYNKDSGNYNDYIELDMTADQKENYILQVKTKTAKPKSTAKFCFGTGSKNGKGYITYNTFEPWNKNVCLEKAAYIYEKSSTPYTITQKNWTLEDIDLTIDNISENEKTWFGPTITSSSFMLLPRNKEESINYDSIEIVVGEDKSNENKKVYHFGDVISNGNGVSVKLVNEESNFVDYTTEEWTYVGITNNRNIPTNDFTIGFKYDSNSNKNNITIENLNNLFKDKGIAIEISGEDGNKKVNIDEIEDNGVGNWVLYKISSNTEKEGPFKLASLSDDSFEPKCYYVLSFEEDNSNIVQASWYDTSSNEYTKIIQSANTTNTYKCEIKGGIIYYDLAGVDDSFYEDDGKFYKITEFYSKSYLEKITNSDEYKKKYEVKSMIDTDKDTETRQTLARIFEDNDKYYTYLYVVESGLSSSTIYDDTDIDWAESNREVIGFYIDEYGNIGGAESFAGTDTATQYYLNGDKFNDHKDNEKGYHIQVKNDKDESKTLFRSYKHYSGQTNSLDTYITSYSNTNDNGSLILLGGYGKDLKLGTVNGNGYLKVGSSSITIKNLPLTTNKKLTVSEGGAIITGATTIQDTATNAKHSFTLGSDNKKSSITGGLSVSNGATISGLLTANSGLEINDDNTWGSSGKITASGNIETTGGIIKASSTVSGTDFLFLAD